METSMRAPRVSTISFEMFLVLLLLELKSPTSFTWMYLDINIHTYYSKI